MTDAAPPGKTPRGRRWLLAAGLVAVTFVLGAAAGVYAAGFLGQGEDKPESPMAEPVPHAEQTGRMELAVGRIAVVIPSDQGSKRLHMLISPLVVAHSPTGSPDAGHGAADAEAGTGPVAELRDTFIEYLSQLREAEVRGSLGLVTLRAELLRRARAVAPELNASAVLIQEFVIQ